MGPGSALKSGALAGFCLWEKGNQIWEAIPGGICSASWAWPGGTTPAGTESPQLGQVSSCIAGFPFSIALSQETAGVTCAAELVQLVSSSQTPNSDSHPVSFLHRLLVWACFKA